MRDKGTWFRNGWGLGGGLVAGILLGGSLEGDRGFYITSLAGGM